MFDRWLYYKKMYTVIIHQVRRGLERERLAQLPVNSYSRYNNYYIASAAETLCSVATWNANLSSFFFSFFFLLKLHFQFTTKENSKKKKRWEEGGWDCCIFFCWMLRWLRDRWFSFPACRLKCRQSLVLVHSRSWLVLWLICLIKNATAITTLS